jgi:bifunctional N-acetylglucosamine-1-phosphate-uridyltransferase/glucosamine-1-phosphate-acetyltransferase GlmU-like protein
MIDYLFDLYRPVARRFVLVTHPSVEVPLKAHCAAIASDLTVEFALQAEPTGMLDAILLASDKARHAQPSRLWITWCDQIAVHTKTIALLQRFSSESPEPDVVMPTARQQNPYIHLERDGDGRIAAIRHRREGDSMPPVGESDIGLFSLSAKAYFAWLPSFGLETGQSPRTRERNFLPFLPWMVRQGRRVVTFPCTHELEALGVNTPEDQRRVERYFAERDPS